MRVKFTDRQQQAWKLLPDGIYWFAITAAATGYSDSKLAELRGCDNLELTLGIWETAQDFAHRTPHATSVTDEIVFGARADDWAARQEAKLNTLLRTIGWTRPDGTPIQPGDEFDLDPSALKGRVGKVHLKQKTYTGRDGKDKTALNVYIYVADHEQAPAAEPPKMNWPPPVQVTPKPQTATANPADDTPF